MMSGASLNRGNNNGGGVDEDLVAKKRNFIFTIEIASEQLQRQAGILPWTKSCSGGEGKVQESPVQRQAVKFYSWMRVFREMGQKKKRRGLRTGMLRTAHNSAGGEEDTQQGAQ